MEQPGDSAGALLRRARRLAGLTQAELAARAGVTQSVVSAYESGHRQPALPTLAALIEATGHELVTCIRRPTRLTGPVAGARVGLVPAADLKPCVAARVTRDLASL
jgi:transcriptional regulator with XRE-family HTH domain